LALDELKDGDDVFENDGIKFLVNKDLLMQCKEIKVDFVDSGPRSGFAISSPVPIGGGGCGSSCGSSGGSCGC